MFLKFQKENIFFFKKEMLSQTYREKRNIWY